ncbi:MAG: AMP nucleosidase [Alphaproteobacteria bacterium]|jgi:AMP nucleosidase|nr:AMP nucleosidase [Alphaproteobacteria bacterium]MDP7222468.1 AMP nucleosidase [Alphaproteobacteria bacterium]
MTQKDKNAQTFRDPHAAIDEIIRLYDESVTSLVTQFEEYAAGTEFKARVRAFYPYVRIDVNAAARTDSRLSYGFVPKPGIYETTVTRPGDIFYHYLKEQIRLLLMNHDCGIEVGLSDTPIPLHFALGEDYHLEESLSPEQIDRLPDLFDQPHLDHLDDRVPNCRFVPKDGEASPLALFDGPRTDFSLMRLKHYTGTYSKHFQNYVIFTNYQFYIDEFIKIGHDLMTDTPDKALKPLQKDYTAFVEPGNKVTVNRNIEDNDEKAQEGVSLSRMPQMPAYHLKRADGSGITMVNIGVGPSNAKTITDHIAVLRPHAWLMLGHCAGLRNSQQLGDYVLAHGYVREDNVLDYDLHPSIPIPALAEIQVALQDAVAKVTGYSGYDLKKIMRTGTVATVDDRNWELRPAIRNNIRLSQSRAIALDMESGTIAANGFRFRVPYGTLLCVSDKPMHGQLKLPGMAESFYRQRVDQHLQIGLLTMSILRDTGAAKLHSRKLRSFNEVAFQ